MTPEAFAEIMDRAYAQMRPWSAQEIANTLAAPYALMLARPKGGLIAQLITDECEILALATDPDAQRQGVASSLLNELIELARSKGATRILLEVAHANRSARAFYATKGFALIGTRPSYYTLRDGTKDDALLLSLAIAQGQDGPAPTS